MPEKEIPGSTNFLKSVSQDKPKATEGLEESTKQNTTQELKTFDFTSILKPISKTHLNYDEPKATEGGRS